MTIHWVVPIFVKFIPSFIVCPILMKVVASFACRKKLLLQQFLWCLLFSILLACAVIMCHCKPFSFATTKVGSTAIPLVLIVASVGILNSLACYCQWRAVDISLSKTAVLMQPDDLIAMGLGYWLLKETEFLSASLAAGIILCVMAAGMLIFYDKKKLVGESNWKLLGWVMGYSVPWGVAYFFIRYCNLQDMAPAEWLIGWYTGSSIGASLILFHSHDCVIGNGKKINAILSALGQKGGTRAKLGELLIFLKNHPKFLLPLFAVFVWLAMLIGFWAGNRAPITAYQPLYMVGQSVFRCLIGFYIFSEKTEISWGELSAFPVGILGSFFIAISLPA